MFESVGAPLSHAVPFHVVVTILTVILFVFTDKQAPLCTTALKWVVVEIAPTKAPVKVVDVLAISIGFVNTASDDFCHFTTLPTFPDNVMSAGCELTQIV